MARAHNGCLNIRHILYSPILLSACRISSAPSRIRGEALIDLEVTDDSILCLHVDKKLRPAISRIFGYPIKTQQDMTQQYFGRVCQSGRASSRIRWRKNGLTLSVVTTSVRRFSN